MKKHPEALHNVCEINVCAVEEKKENGKKKFSVITRMI